MHALKFNFSTAHMPEANIQTRLAQVQTRFTVPLNTEIKYYKFNFC